MKLKAYEETLNDYLDKIEKLTEKANLRTLSVEEKTEMELLQNAYENIKIKYDAEKERQDKAFEEHRAVATGDRMKGLIMPGEKLETRSTSKDNLSFGGLVKGMSGLGWGLYSKEQEYYRAMQSGQNKVVIPQTLAGKIIDYARNSSAILGNIPTVIMDSNNMTIAVQKTDPTASWVQEGDLITESAATFEGVELAGKTLAIWVPISEQLLESASNLSQQLMNSCSKAIGVALDKAILYGTGVGAEIKGLTTYNNINKIEYDPVDLDAKNYDLLIKAVGEIKKNNLNPTNIALNVGLATDLITTKSADGFYIMPPPQVGQYISHESNNLKQHQGIAYDKECLVLGIHKDVTIKWGTVADQFQRLQTGLRVHLRVDLGVLNEKGITWIKEQ